MNASTCPEHAAQRPNLWNPEGAPCPVKGCPNGTPFIDHYANGARYVRSSDMIPEHWVRLSNVPAIDTTKEGS